MPFELLTALRFLREGRFQSVLIVAGVAVGTAVVIFITALISGLQADIIDRTLGTQPHIVMRPQDDEARNVYEPPEGEVVAARVERRAQRLRSVDGWQQTLGRIAATPGVAAVSPMVSGPAFALRGSAEKSVALLGINQEEYLKIVPVDKKLKSGRFRAIGDEAVIGVDLAHDLGAAVGDKVRLSTGGGRTQVVTVSGIFDLGVRDLNRRWVFLPLRSAQNLLDLAGGVTNIDLKVTEIFQAENISEVLAARTGLKAESWMKTNSELMAGLRGQTGSTLTIRFFVTVSVAFGIASVLVVSVVQKGREIGILRAMGASSASILMIFLIQGALVAILGSIAGCGLGSWFALLFQTWVKTFSVRLSLNIYLTTVAGAFVVGIAAAIAPALRAARLEPAQAIRHV